MNTRTLVLLIPLLVCVGFIPVAGLPLMIIIILYYAYKEIKIWEKSNYESFNDRTASKINMDEYNTDVLEKCK